MKITPTLERYDKVTADLLAVPFFAGRENRAFKAIDRDLGRALSKLAASERFKGEEDRTLVWFGKVRRRDAWVVVIGMGKEQAGPDAWRTASGKAVGFATGHRLETMAVFIDGDSSPGRERIVRWIAEGLMLSAYRFGKYKSKKSKSPPREAIIGLGPAPSGDAELRRAVQDARAAAEGVMLARNLVNEPANVLSPQALAEAASSLAEKKGLECTVLGEEEIRALRMNLLLAVAAGSDRPPRFIHLVYRPKQPAQRKVALVGKGITFDSGGLCIKPGKSMYDMKTDMAGAGVVLGVLSALRALELPVEVHGIVPATDNTINGKATRPGDVFKSLAGVTVEVLNTDAEGRLILADALTYAEEQKPDAIIDHATLTGSCAIALGPNTAGLFSDDEPLARDYLDAAVAAGELFWRLPLAKDLEKEIRSDVADIKNIGGRYGGAITAALFLKHFVKKTKWVHVDIAGPARTETGSPFCPKGGTGFGVLTALEYLSKL